MTMVPLLGHDGLGLSSVALGVALSCLALTDVAAMEVAGRLLNHRGRRGLLVGALGWGTVAAAVMSDVSSFWVFALCAMAVGVTVGTTWVVPTAMAVDVAVNAEGGLAAYRISSDVGLLLGGIAAGAAVSISGPAGAFWWAAGALLAGAVLALAVGETRPRAAAGVDAEPVSGPTKRRAAVPDPTTVEVTP
jgi:MFS family permease